MYRRKADRRRDLRAMLRGARILVAPLDWGLGHAARCVPVVQALLEQGSLPVIGADKGALALLRDAFPAVEAVRIPGMEVRYGSGRSQAWAMARQFPAMLRQVHEEHAWLARNRGRLQLDAVVSDQRFGLHSPALPSVLITHQVFPFTPFGRGIARRINHRHIQRFDHCWIPDHADAPGLAGDLSHGGNMPVHARYIGPLSRFPQSENTVPSPAYRVVAVISGPEPQRTLLEQRVLHQLPSIPGPHLLLTGKPGAEHLQSGQVKVLGHLPARELESALRQAELVVGRTGYSTLMDLEALDRGALLIPTPGQPEQEYLGRLHGPRGTHLVQAQDQLNIAVALGHRLERHGPCKSAGAWSSALSELAGSIARHRTAHRP